MVMTTPKRPVPPDEDKRYFYDGAAYAMAYGPTISNEEWKAHKREQKAKRRVAREARRQEAMIHVFTWMAGVYQ